MHSEITAYSYNIIKNCKIYGLNLTIDLDLDSSHIQLDTSGHTPTPSVSAATSASSQVNPIFCRSLLTVLLQFALGRSGLLLYFGTCQCSACCGMRWWSIPRKTCPSQQSRLSPSMLSIVCCPVLVLTSVSYSVFSRDAQYTLLLPVMCSIQTFR